MRKKVIDSSRRCITCLRPCGMTGLCMKPWPEFNLPGAKGGNNGGKNKEKNR